MKYLVFCPCGHALDRHGSGGCSGEQRDPCSCPFDQRRALDAAIDRVRSDPWDLLKDRVAEKTEAAPRR
jgi:hypothetical protein